jgi:hypothetical protein
MNKYSKSIVVENVNALKAEQGNNLWMRRHKRMCWKCQKDKPMEKGVGLTFVGNLARFICLDCTQAKLKEKNFD